METKRARIFKKATAISMSLIILFVIGAAFGRTRKAESDKAADNEAQAAVIAGKKKINLIDTTLGERRMSKDTNFLFDRNDEWMVFGEGWDNWNSGSEISGGTTLKAIRLDGTGEHQVTGRRVTKAVISQDGRAVFTDQDQDLYAIPLVGGPEARLAIRVAAITLSGDRRRLVCKKLNPTWGRNGNYENSVGVSVVDLTDSRETLIDNDPEAWGFVWSPDDKRILSLSHSETGMGAFYLMNADGTGRRQLTNIGHGWVRPDSVPMPSEQPVWSKDGKWLAFESDRQIWMLELDKDFNVVKAKPVGYGKHPEWDADGASLHVLVGNGDDFSDSKRLKLDLDGRVIGRD